MCEPSGAFHGVYATADGKKHFMRVPMRCNKWTCEYCGKRKGKKLYARIINVAIMKTAKKMGYRDKYSIKMLTLTPPGKEYRARFTPAESLEHMAKAFDKLNRALRKVFGSFFYLRAVEYQKNGYPHYHVMLVGRAIAPKAVLQYISGGYGVILTAWER